MTERPNIIAGILAGEFRLTVQTDRGEFTAVLPATRRVCDAFRRELADLLPPDRAENLRTIIQGAQERCTKVDDRPAGESERDRRVTRALTILLHDQIVAANVAESAA